MGRNIKSLDPPVVTRVEDLLKKGILQKKIASRVGLDIRWVSDISVAMKRREAAGKLDAEEQDQERHALEEPGPGALEKAEAAEVDDSSDTYFADLVKLTRKAIPLRKRVKVIKSLLDSPNAQLQKAGLDQLNAIEGIGKGKDAKPYEPGPMFIIDTVPEFRPMRRKDAEDPRDQIEEEDARTTRHEAQAAAQGQVEAAGQAATGSAGGDRRGAFRVNPNAPGFDDCTAACPRGGHQHKHGALCTCGGCQGA